MPNDNTEGPVDVTPMRVYTAAIKRQGFEVVFFSYSRAAALEQLRAELPDARDEEIRVSSYFIVESRMLRTERRKG